MDGSGFYLAGPQEETLPITKEIYKAFQLFLRGEKPTGTVMVEFRSGGQLMEVKALTIKKYLSK